MSIPCTVFKSLRKNQTYLFVPVGSDLEGLPDVLLGLLGELEKVLNVDLEAGRKLARAEASEVMRCIKEQGFFLQMPPGKEELDQMGSLPEALLQ